MDLEPLYNAFLESEGVTIDTRDLKPGSIFFALKGEKQDGNRFAEDALEKGARAVVVSDPSIENERAFKVEDPLKTLQDLARHHRKQLDIPVIAITGSNGKTTTKELTAKALAEHYTLFATPGNLNNHIGLPLSVLSIQSHHDMALLEFGANHPGENELLASICDPTHGLVTNIGLDHLEGFGDREGVFQGNKELIEHLSRKNGHGFFHSDDPDIRRMEAEMKLSSTHYGTQPGAELQGKLLKADPYLELEWKWTGTEPVSHSRLKSSLIGTYNLPNILAALCIGSYFAVPKDRMESAIASYEPDNNRSQFLRTDRNALLLDAYNANPSSMEAAIESFLNMEGSPKAFILGDMLEMGDHEEKVHRRIVDLLQEKGLTEGILVGKAFHQAAAGSDITAYQTLEEAKEALQRSPYEGYRILIKGSRGLKLEELLEQL